MDKICQHCGHLSTPEDPVIERYIYVGGKAPVRSVECEDRLACWRRWDEKYMFVKGEGK